MGVNALQTLGGGGPSLSFFPLFPPSLPLSLSLPSFLLLIPSPFNSARSGERCKLPQRVMAAKRILVRLEVKVKRFRGQIYFMLSTDKT